MRTAQLVLLLGVPDAAWIDELIAARVAERRTTVLDLVASDLGIRLAERGRHRVPGAARPGWRNGAGS